MGLARIVARRGGRDRRLCRGHHLVCPAGGGHQPTQPLAGSNNGHGLRDLVACRLRDPGCCGWIPALRWADPWIWPLLLLLLTLPVWRCCASAIGQPSAARIQAAVKHAILTLILLDAAICLATVGHFEALAVLSLSLPFLVLGHWVYST